MRTVHPAHAVGLPWRVCGRSLSPQIVLQQLPAWRKASVDGRVAMPRLVDVDWRVDVKTSAEALTRMSVPTLLVDMKVGALRGDARVNPRSPCSAFVLAGPQPTNEGWRHAGSPQRQL